MQKISENAYDEVAERSYRFVVRSRTWRVIIPSKGSHKYRLDANTLRHAYLRDVAVRAFNYKQTASCLGAIDSAGYDSKYQSVWYFLRHPREKVVVVLARIESDSGDSQNRRDTM